MKRFIEDMKKHYNYVLYAGRSELKAEVANSYLNWLWWIIEPLCFMFIYSLVFGVFFGGKMDHINVFVYIGITMWDFFNHMVVSSVKIIRSNKPIVAKVYMPKYIFLFIKMYVNLFKMFVSLILLFIMALVTGIPFTWQVLWIIPTILTMVSFTFAVCSFLLHFGVYVEDLENVTRIFLRIMFYLTGIFYDLEERVTKAYNHHVAMILEHVNPMATVIVSMRKAIMYGKMPDYKYLLLWFVLGLIFSAIGISIIYKNENSYVKVI